MDDIRSYNSRVAPSFKHLVMPTYAQFLLNLVLGIILLVILNIRAVWQFFTTGVTAESTVDIGSLITEKAPWFTGIIEKITQGRFVQILFWLFVGCIVYMLIWFLGNFFTNIRNDIIADEYVHPRSYSRAGYWGSIFGRKIFFIILLIVLIAYIYAGAQLVVALADLTYQSFLEFQLPISPLAILGAVIGAAIALQILQMLLRITKNSWQIIYKDL